MTTQNKNTDILDEIFLEPLEESDSESSLEIAYVMIVDNNAVVSITAPQPQPPIAKEVEEALATSKLDESILKRFEEQKTASKRIEDQQRELKLMYKKSQVKSQF